MSTFTPEQIDAWDHATEEGSKLLERGKETRQQASQDEQRKRPKHAADKYEEAISQFQQALEQLQTPAQLNYEHAAIRLLSQKARSKRDEAEQQLQQLRQERAVERCRELRARAETLLNEASQALEADNQVEARSKAIEASDLDQTLSEAADEIKRAADSDNSETSSYTGLIVVGVVILILIGLAIFFGPKLWAWISEFLFPAQSLWHIIRY